MKNITVLAIESSCDETAASVYTTQEGVLSNKLYSQIELHQQYGGVVPEIASRSHMEKMSVIVQDALNAAHTTLENIDIIAVTNKPGLPGSLLIGVCFAKALAWSSNKKLIGVNHLEGHAFSACIEHTIPFPFLCITASGGHTALYIVHGFGDYTTIGQTLDDAAGEAFDKIAKLINLPYPGGPLIEQLAAQAGFQDFFNYPRPMPHTLDFSFSGLKTAVLYDLVKRDAYDLAAKKFLKPDDLEFKQQVASSLLVCVADIFEQKLALAFKHYPDIKAVAFVGGVAANKYIGSRLDAFCQKRSKEFFVPARQYCTDNAAMIAFVGHYKAQQNKFDDFTLDIY
ncbi:tRNA (adenosine(37)-N6)-threonylcarbamoyltransferase complex transferase subunit TsaD [Candidatus Dependentiae bacterium]|nr:tRNA (adenosine(37)-N6)-threonylcarbamoyltransferase complex transferase subunit TsaD [Candidatus Dependentiae bacterium]